MTPVVDQCTHNCLFCWRVQGFDQKVEQWREPEEVLDACIAEQKKLVSGFGGDARCSKEMWNEAREPKQVAISLSGEPTMYPYLGEFIRTCHRRGMTTFLVTNGTFPEVLEKLDPLPTQLYVTVAAPNEEVYKRLCVPRIPDGWQRLMRTLELFPSLGTRTVVRHTLVKDWNIGWEDDYAKLDELADPTVHRTEGLCLRRRLPPAHEHRQHAAPCPDRRVLQKAGGPIGHGDPEGKEGQPGAAARSAGVAGRDTRALIRASCTGAWSRCRNPRDS